MLRLGLAALVLFSFVLGSSVLASEAHSTTISIPLGPDSAFEAQCDDSGDEDQVFVTYLWLYKISNADLAAFYWDQYRKLYKAMYLPHKSTVTFEQIFGHAPMKHWVLVAPVYRGFGEFYRDEYDYDSVCQNFKRELAGSSSSLKLELKQKIQDPKLSCEGKCFRSAYYELTSVVLVRTKSRRTIESQIPSYLPRGASTHEEVPAELCSGQSIPNCPDPWN